MAKFHIRQKVYEYYSIEADSVEEAFDIIYEGYTYPSRAEYLEVEVVSVEGEPNTDTPDEHADILELDVISSEGK